MKLTVVDHMQTTYQINTSNGVKNIVEDTFDFFTPQDMYGFSQTVSLNWFNDQWAHIDIEAGFIDWFNDQNIEVDDMSEVNHEWLKGLSEKFDSVK